jgi:ribonuclease M5
MGKPRIKEVILVEGRYDKNALSQVVDAAIVETGGFKIFKDREKMEFFRLLAEKRGLIILTDSDGAGFLIRNHLKGAIPNDRLRQAYVPDVYGKEKRKREGGKEGKLGVEGMKPEVLLAALRNAGATFEDEDAPEPKGAEPITKADMFALGLAGGQGSAEKRAALLRRLSLPEHLTANAMIDALNILMTRGEFMALASEGGR